MTASPGSPLLDRATNPREMLCYLTQIVEAHWATATLEAINIPRVMPTSSGEILIQYALQYREHETTGFAPKILYAQHYPNPAPAIEGKSVKWMWDAGLRLRIWLFPNDPELDKLGVLFDPEQFHREYDKELEKVGFNSHSIETRSEMLGYRLGRRCVTRVSRHDTNGRSVPRLPRNDIVLKMCRKPRSPVLWALLQQFEQEGFGSDALDGISMPKPLFHHPATGVIAQDHVPIPSLHSQLGTSAFADHCERAASALSKLHLCRILGLGVHAVGDEIAHLRWLVGTTGESFAIVARDLTSKLSGLERSQPDGEVHFYVTSHRDFYDKQILIGAERTVLLDCDTVAMADPALDYCNFLAHLLWRKRQYPERAGMIEKGMERFAASYEGNDDEFAERASWWTSASLLRLACLYCWRPQWRDRAVDLLHIDPHTLPASRD